MNAWRVHSFGAFEEVLTWESCPTPEAPRDGVLVKVAAVGLNFPDLLLIAGKYQVRPTLPFIPGMEAAGIVTHAGASSQYAVGQRVIVNGIYGAFAEQVAAPDSYVFPIPDDMSDADAAALHVIYQTSYMGLVYRAQLQAGETLLVHGGSGGVGTSAIQLGKALGARVLATASTPEKIAICKQAGADECIPYKEQDFVSAVMDLTDGKGADVIYDPVGGEVFEKSSKCIAFAGRLLVIGFASGTIPSIAANRILLKNISIVGLHWGNYYKHAPHRVAQTHAALLDFYAAGSIKPVLYAPYTIDELPKALSAIANRKSHGKVVVTLP